MKKYTKAMTMGMVVAMMGSTMAFAEIKEGETKLIATEVTGAVDEKQEAAFISQNGKVVSVNATEKGAYEILIDNENGGLRFMVSSGTTIVDRESGSYFTLDQLTDGMEVSVIYGATSPMGMSMPPFLGQVTAVVANADKGGLFVGDFDENLLSKKGSLVINITEDTVIRNTTGTKNILTADDVKGKNALIFFDVTTRSIPAQTTPSFVLILEEKEVVQEKTEELVALRGAAEEKGYKVTWQGHDKPVLVENEKETMEITIDSTKYVVDDNELVASRAATLVDGILYISADILA